jgi:hypothetical protein
LNQGTAQPSKLAAPCDPGRDAPSRKPGRGTTRNLELNVLWLNLFHHGDHSVEGLMLDNVVASKSRIGCL